jgi:glutathione S-transferase
VIADPSSDPNEEPTYVTDSFNIATYLDEKYPAPQYPIVFPVGTRPLQKLFLDHFLTTISAPLITFIAPHLADKVMDPQEQEYMYRSRGKDNFAPPTEIVAAQKLVEGREKWEAFSQVLELNGGDGSAGPFVMGDRITFADFAVGGMLSILDRVAGDEGNIWKEVMQWQGGKWARFWKEIEGLEKKTSELA